MSETSSGTTDQRDLTLPKMLSSSSPVVTVLTSLARSCGLEVNETRIIQCVREAERAIPGDWSSTWAHRLVEVGRDIGLRISVKRFSLNEAINLVRPDLVVATLRVKNDSLTPIVLLNKKRRSVQVQTSSVKTDQKWIRVADLKEQFRDKASGNGEVALWMTADLLTPFQPLTQQPEKEHYHPHGPSPWSRLMGMLQADRSDLRVIILFALGVGIFSLSIPIAVEAIVNTVQGGTSILLQPVIALALVLFGFLIIATILRVLKAFVVEYLQQRIFVRVTADLAWRLPRARVESFDQHHGPELANRFFDVLTVQKASATLMTEGLSVTIQTGLGLLVLAFYNPYLLGFDLILLGAICFIVFVLGRGGIRTSIEESYAKYKVAGWLEEMLRHPLSFKMNGGPDLALERADSLARNYVDARRAHFRVVFRQIFFTLLLQAGASAALLGLGGWLVITRGLTVGQLVAAELILTMIVGAVVKFGKSFESYYDLMAGVDKLGHLIDLPLDRDGGEVHRPQQGAEPASLIVHQLCFEYAETHQRVIENLSFEIRPGERVAMIGPHGSGKSTLVDLLYGLRDPVAGYLALDGVDYRDIDPQSLRANVATAKGLEVFEGSVTENVRMGRYQISLSDIREALRRVHLLDEILELPEGLSTRVLPGGTPLSFGQAKRLMLARAIAVKPRLLIIDEAFDYLHEDVREHLLRELFKKDVPWTLLVITHSRDVANRCERIIRLPKVGATPTQLKAIDTAEGTLH